MNTGSAWSWQRPVEPGWFWFKPKTVPNYIRALRVFSMDDADGQLFVACDRFSRLSSPYYEGGLWQRIPEPLP